MKLAPGTRLGPYVIVSAIGAGGMGEVYRARDPRLGRDVAIKLLPEAFAADATRLHRFEQEARAAGQLEGESLRARLQGGPIPARKSVDYARQTAEGLAAAHDKNIVHRDVKPDN